MSAKRLSSTRKMAIAAAVVIFLVVVPIIVVKVIIPSMKKDKKTNTDDQLLRMLETTPTPTFPFYTTTVPPKKLATTDWMCIDGIEQGVATTPVRLYEGNVQCMSVDAANCKWVSTKDQCNLLIPPTENLRPLTCFENQYNISGHWCKNSKAYLENNGYY